MLARVGNYAVLLLSPILLVRLLDVHAYGQYREFVLYAMIAILILGFSIRTNLFYFIPKDPKNERAYLTQSVLFLFVSSLVGLSLIFVGRHLIVQNTSFYFITQLLTYVFFFLNLDAMESYWLAQEAF